MVKLTMYKFYNSPNNIYLETDRIKIQKENKSTKQSPKVNINTLLNRVKIEEKKKLKKIFFFCFLVCWQLFFLFSFYRFNIDIIFLKKN